MNIALAQMDIALGESETNLRTASALVAEAAAEGAALVVLPELWGSGYDLEHANFLADEVNTGLWGAVSALARHHRVAICGSLLEWDVGEERPYNTAFVYDNDGRLRGTYRKIHRFGPMREDQFLGAGDTPKIVDAPWGKTALAICYDLRFPELFRRYALDGAPLVIIPAEWPVQRMAHWRTLVQARAIENQCWVVACNRVGRDADNAFGGGSLIVDPWGTVVAEAGNAATMMSAEIDLALVDEVRSRLPVLADRRPEVYGLDARNDG